MNGGYLLDTNVISEVVGNAPTNPGVAAFLNEQADLWLPVVAIHELEYGVRRLPHGRRRDALAHGLAAFAASYGDRILPVDIDTAVRAAELRAVAEARGRVLTIADALIAGSAKARGLAVATRNVKDFEQLGIDVFDPWSAATEPA